MNKKSGMSINTKISLLVIMMVIFSSAFVGIFSFIAYRNDCIDYKAETTINVTESVSSIIDGDEFAKIVESDQKTDYYYQYEQVFKEIRERTDMEYLYAIAHHGDGVNYRYIFDADGGEAFGTLDEIEGYGAEVTFANGIPDSSITSSEEYGRLISGFSPVFDSNGALVGAIGADLQIEDVLKEINNFGIQILIAALLFNILFILLIRIYLNRSLGRPIQALTRLGEHMAEGNLEAKEHIASNDEIGLLAGSFNRVGDTLRRLMAEMEEMAARQRAGDYEALIDAENYKGAFNTVASDVNDMARGHVVDFKDVIAAFEALEHGDFDAEMRRFPGKKEIINQAIDHFRAVMKGLNNAIRTLATAATNGDLTKTIDAEEFKGGWRTLTEELNKLMGTVRAPLQEAEASLAKMSAGDFTVKMTGDYKGDFAIIKHSINKMQDSISSYISEISEILRAMAAQNLNVRITRQYIGDFNIIRNSINMIIDTFNHTLTDINTSADLVATGAKQISEISYNISQGASEQVSTVEQLTASMDQISDQTEHNENTAGKANTLALDVKNNALKEADMMLETLKAMEEINKASADISKIIKVIEDISFQTNILALNAAVEAARAGIHGKGFAVVAEEVGNLAGRSQAAVKETTDLIDGSVRKAREGTRVTTETAEGLNEIVGQITEIADYMHEIVRASAEQRENIGQISAGIAQIAQVTQSNTAISEESAAASEELSSQADMFKNTVGQFKLL